MRVCRNAPGRTLQVGRRPVHPARLSPMRRAYSSSLTPTPRHSHRSGNPEPFRCANLMRVCRNAPGRTLQVGRRPVHPARLSPMRRAYSSSLTPTPRHSHRSGNPEPFRCANLMRVCRNAPGRTLQVGRRPVHPARLRPMRRAYSSSLTPTPRHSHRSGNPEPFRWANAVIATKIRQVGG